MGSKFVFRHLPLCQILADDWTLATTPRWMKHPELEQSIQKHGILSPIHLVSAGAEKFRIISGFRRFQAAVLVQLEEVPVLVRPAEPDLNFFLEQLEANRSSRTLELPEQALAVAKLYREFDQPAEMIIDQILPLLGLKPDRYHLKKCLRVADLKEPFQRAILRGLDPDLALEMDNLPQDDGKFCLRLFKQWELGKPRQRQLLQLLTELSKIRSEDFSVVWDAAGLPEDFTAARFDEAKKALSRLRYPRLEQHSERYRLLCQALELPDEVRLEIPAFFEGNELSVTIRACNPDELGRLAEQICRLSSRSELKEIFALL